MREEKTIGELYDFLQEHMVTKQELRNLENRFIRFDKKTESKFFELYAFLQEHMVTRREFNEKSEGVDKRFEEVEERLDRIDSKMATKDYFEEKVADQRGDLVLARKEDKKINHLVSILERKEVLSDEEAREIYGLDPFPRISS